MNGLPREFNTLVTTLEQYYSGENKLTMALLQPKLTHEAMKIESQSKGRTQALGAQVKPKWGKNTDTVTNYFSEDSVDDEQVPSITDEEEVLVETSLRRSGRIAKEPGPEIAAYIATINDEPTTYKDAISCKDAKMWKDAMNEELKSLSYNGTWVETSLPKGRKAIGCKWVFKIKRDDSGNAIRYKARLVAKGYSQKEGIDYGEIFIFTGRFGHKR